MGWKKVIIGSGKTDLLLNIAVIISLLLFIVTLARPVVFSKPISPVESRYVHVTLTLLQAPELKAYQPVHVLPTQQKSSNQTVSSYQQTQTVDASNMPTSDLSFNNQISQSRIEKLLEMTRYKLF